METRRHEAHVEAKAPPHTGSGGSHSCECASLSWHLARGLLGAAGTPHPHTPPLRNKPVPGPGPGRPAGGGRPLTRQGPAACSTRAPWRPARGEAPGTLHPGCWVQKQLARPLGSLLPPQASGVS